MGILDQLKGQVLSKATELLGQNKQLGDALSGLIQGNGGVQGLVKMFQDKGLGDAVNSWVSKGQNLPVNPQQIVSALGADKIKQLAGTLGVSTDQAGSQLAQWLPQLIDKLTPNGKVEN